VDACVKRLRQKLGTAGSAIQTVRGVGYRFADPNARDD
jgi:DNA-binding response OmpR family regulator